MEIGKPMRSIIVEPLEAPARTPELEPEVQSKRSGVCASSRTTALATLPEEQPIGSQAGTTRVGDTHRGL
jgi:hypothetical protein